MRCRHVHPLVSTQRGFTLVEILVSLAIGIFLIGGLITIQQGTRRTSINQTALSQLQDEQRLALSLLNDTVQNAGYFDTTTKWATTDAFVGSTPATTGSGTITLAAGQVIGGTHTSATTSDQLVVAYGTTGSDGILNCAGATASSSQVLYNVFTIANEILQCGDGVAADTPIQIVKGVHNMQIWYGIATQGTSAVPNNNVDTYRTADQLTSAQWLNVTSVRVLLQFDNPLWGQPGQSSQYINITRVIALKARTGSVRVLS